MQKPQLETYSCMKKIHAKNVHASDTVQFKCGRIVRKHSRQIYFRG